MPIGVASFSRIINSHQLTQTLINIQLNNSAFLLPFTYIRESTYRMPAYKYHLQQTVREKKYTHPWNNYEINHLPFARSVIIANWTNNNEIRASGRAKSPFHILPNNQMSHCHTFEGKIAIVGAENKISAQSLENKNINSTHHDLSPVAIPQTSTHMVRTDIFHYTFHLISVVNRLALNRIKTVLLRKTFFFLHKCVFWCWSFVVYLHILWIFQFLLTNTEKHLPLSRMF